MQEHDLDATLARTTTTILDAICDPLQQMADAADRRADSMARIARTLSRARKDFRRLVNWITSEATMDEASAALSRALHPQAQEVG